MDSSLKKTLKAVTLELRHLLEGQYDAAGKWQPGDLEQRLAAIGVRRDRESAAVDELGHLADEDKHARKVVDAYIQLREEAGVSRTEAVAEFVRETAYTWANRLLALRCMEARELIDEVILQKEVYGGRSLEHHRLAQREPEHCTGEDDGRFVMLQRVFAKQAERLPMLFDPQSPGVALRPSPAVLKRCIALLSGTQTVRNHEPAVGEVFTASDSLGWAYQYWNTEEKDRVFEKVRTQKGAKIEGADIVPATQLYTESYMVQFLVQNSLGATWMGMHPDSKLYEQWDYYVRDADRAPVESKPVRELTFLDPACGSGHFLLEAFDLLYAMYEEEGELTEPEDICDAILTKNLYGIDIDARSIQIAEVALWMKAAEHAIDYAGVPTNLVAAVSSHLKGTHWDEFLASFEKEPSVARVLRKFGELMEHIDELGSLARPNEDLKKIIAEEHAVWEQQVREQKEANYLFSEMRKEAVSGKLAFNEISDEEFGDRLFYRVRAALDAFTVEARERGEFQDQFLGEEASTGFKLLGVLGQTFDVVAANPPYLGSQSMGPTLKQHIQRNWKSAKRDVYAAFILRSLQLAKHGRAAMVTQQSWMFLKQMHHLRDEIIPFTSVEVLGHLGPGAFEEISGAHVNVVLFVLTPEVLSRDHRVTAIRPAWGNSIALLQDGIRDACAGQSNSHRFSTRQTLLIDLPNRPLVYWCSDYFLELLRSETPIEKSADVTYTASANTRFVRNCWEVADRTRWLNYSKGGGLKKWVGLEQFVVDWGNHGARVSAHVTDSYPPDKYSLWIKLPPTRTNAVVWSEIGSGTMGARITPPPTVVSRTGPAILIRNENEASRCLGLLNSRAATYLLRLSCSGLHFAYPYVAKLHYPELVGCSELADTVLKAAALLAEHRINESRFNPAHYSGIQSLQKAATAKARQLLGVVAVLHALEGIIEEAAFDAFGMSESLQTEVLADTRPPSGWLPFDGSQFALPETPLDVPESVSIAWDSFASRHKDGRWSGFVNASGSECGDDTVTESAETEGRENEEDEFARTPVPATSDLEALAFQTQTHPVSVYWLLTSSKQQEHEILSDRLQQFCVDWATVKILHALGHKWRGETSETPVDADGIIPVSELPTQFAREEPRLVKRIQSGFSDNADSDLATVDRDFASLVGEDLEDWVNDQFFQHHIGQFKKRPIAWHIRSTPLDERHQSVYGCLAYYHKLDGDLIRKVRKQSEDVRKSFETELRGITSTPADARSDRQEQRRVYLEDGIGELQRFDATLGRLIRSGFGPETLVPTLWQYAIDDATLALNARWLRRFSSLVADMVLPDWQSAAIAAEIHEELPQWIAQAVTRLQHHCATVGIKPPKAKDVGDEPTSADLAPLICAKSAEMLTGSLKCACGVWWKQFDDTVLGPLKEQVKEMKNERKAIKAQLEGDPPPDPDDVTQLTLRDRDLREDIKPIEKKIKRLKAKATKLRKDIESWTRDEPLSWETWLAGQPLFDEVTSLDGHKSPPTTITEFITQESAYIPDINDGVRVNIAPLQKAGVLAADVLAKKDVDKAIADRAEWRADERRWVREGKLPQPGWWPERPEKGERP